MADTPTWPTDEQVEKAAEAAWQSESVRGSGSPRRIPWAEENEQVREGWRISMRAALSAVNPYEWMPIETAPKDGTAIYQRVLLFVPPYGAGSGNWTGHNWNCHFCLNRDAQPTHWMPLPPSPESDK